MAESLVCFFGLPGAGKSYVADIVSRHFDYYIHNGDEDLPDAMKLALFKKEPITDSMRIDFLDAIISSIASLRTKHPKLAIHQTILKDFMRRRLAQALPTMKFILIQSETAIREERYAKRQYFNLGLPYMRKMSALFDPPTIPHATLINSQNGDASILEQLRLLL